MTEILTTQMDPTGRPAPEPHAGVACCTAADLLSGPVACGLPAGHRGPHAWAALGGPTGSKVPGSSGAERTQAARAAAARSAGGRKVGLHDICGERSKGGALLCAREPHHKGPHGTGKAEGNG